MEDRLCKECRSDATDLSYEWGKEMISIIVPVYNSEKYLKDCVSSVMNQTYRDLEIILVNDASTDSSGKICDEIALSDARVKVIHHKENKGLSATRHDGINESTGEYLGFVDNDDYLAPWVYEMLLNNIADGQMSVLGGTDALNEEFEDKCQSIISIPNCEIIHVTGREADLIYMTGSENYGFISCIWGKLYRHELIEKVLAETTKHIDKLSWMYFEDMYVIPLAYAMAEKVAICKTVGYIHRSRKDSLGNNINIQPYHVQAADCGDEVLQFLKDNGYLKLYDAELELFLANLEGIWSRISRFETPDKKEAELQLIRDVYRKYYKDFARLRKHDAYAFTIFLFYRMNWLWKLTVSKLYFEKKYR